MGFLCFKIDILVPNACSQPWGKGESDSMSVDSIVFDAFCCNGKMGKSFVCVETIISCLDGNEGGWSISLDDGRLVGKLDRSSLNEGGKSGGDVSICVCVGVWIESYLGQGLMGFMNHRVGYLLDIGLVWLTCKALMLS